MVGDFGKDLMREKQGTIQFCGTRLMEGFQEECWLNSPSD